MKNSFSLQEEAAFKFYLSSSEASSDLCVKLKNRLGAFNAFTDIIASDTQLTEKVTALNLAELEAPSKVVALVRASKKCDTTKIATDIIAARQAKEAAEKAQTINAQALNILRSDLSHFYSENLAHLIQWVALQRCKDVLACGEVMPAEVVHIYTQLQFRWFPRWPDGLNIAPMTLNKLPLTWQPTWSDIHRASLVWVWSELAAGHFKFVPIPGRTDTKELCLRLDTYEVERLPAVPKMQTAPAPPKMW